MTGTVALEQNPRSLTIKLAIATGNITRFYAFLDGDRVIAADGTAEASYTGEVPDLVTLKVRVFGIDDASYDLTIDLPGTADDQSLTLSLVEGYNELELSL